MGDAARSHLVLVAGAMLALLVGQVALAGSDPEAETSASAKKQIKALKKRVASLERKSTLPPSGPAGGDLGGSYPNPEIASGAISGSEIADGSLTVSDLAVASETVSVTIPALSDSCGFASGTLPGVLIDDIVIANFVGNPPAPALGVSFTPVRVNNPDQILLRACGTSGGGAVSMVITVVR